MNCYFECSKEGPVVQTKAGKLRGFWWNGTYTFHGIKYADAKRFQMPKEVEAWEGVKDATSYGYVCPLLTQDVPNGEVMVPHRYWPMDENCQYLNIWTQSLDSSAKKPVMVWLHGGGFYAGSSIEQVAYDGTNLSSFGDVVVVSLNHRLNILGYLNLSEYGEKYWNSGNVGNADIVAALRWIKDNIVEFGGDPNNVTLFGQSGGGMKIWTLMQTPEADGLYHKAIIQSGILEDFIDETNTNVRPLILAMLDELHMEENDIEKWETLPYRVLADAYNKVSDKVLKDGGYIGGHPIRNSYYLGDPLQVGFSEYAQGVPVIVGSVFGEMGFGPGLLDKNRMGRDEIFEVLKQRFGTYTSKVINIFEKTYPEKSIGDLLTYDIFFRKPVIKFVSKRAKYKKTAVYSYLFAFEFPLDDGKPAWHCSDLPFVFHNTDKVPVTNIPNVTEKTEYRLCSAWVNFAKTGNPYIDDTILWTKCEEDKENCMVISNNTWEVKSDFDHDLIAKVEEVGIKSPFSVIERREFLNKQNEKKDIEDKKGVFLH